MSGFRSFEEIFTEGDPEPEASESETPAAQEPQVDEEPEEKEQAEEPEAAEAAPAGEDEPEAKPAEAAEEKPAAEKKKKEEEPPVPRLHKVTIDGEEREVDEDELRRGYQTGKASQQRFTEAKVLHEQATAFYQAFLKSPGDALVNLVAKQIGDRTRARERVRDVFLEFLAPDLEESLITDERERQIHRRNRELEDRRLDLDRREQAETQKLTQAQEEAFVKSLRDGINVGLKRHGLPDKDEIWVRAGQLIDMALNAGTKREHALELVPAIMKQISGEREEAAKKLALTLKPEDVERLFPDALEALRQQRIEKVREERSKKRPAGESKPVAKREPRSRYKSMDEVFGKV